MTEGQKQLLNSIRELHRFETSNQQGRDLKALIVEIRSGIIVVESELMALVFQNASLATSTGFNQIQDTLKIAREQCNVYAILADNPSYDKKTIASMFIAIANINGIEVMLESLSKLP
ncbi:MAG: hypothetical protein PXY39_11845 [archaeon]|nr:hypothetical protein [archaeon]